MVTVVYERTVGDDVDNSINYMCYDYGEAVLRLDSLHKEILGNVVRSVGSLVGVSIQCRANEYSVKYSVDGVDVKERAYIEN